MIAVASPPSEALSDGMPKDSNKPIEKIIRATCILGTS